MVHFSHTFYAAALVGTALADGLYTSKSPVLQVTAKTYDSLIAQSNHTSIVEFYAPWCGHCQSLKPAYEKTAKSLAGIAKVAAVNCDEEPNKPLCAQFGVQGFPTLKIVKPGKKAGRPAVEDYQGPRDAKAIVAAVSDKLTNHVKRLQADTLEAWVEEGTKPKVVLFSEKGITAPLVKALAIDFLGVIDFAQVRSKEKAAVDKYEVTKFPTLVLLNGDGTKIGGYDDEISKDNIVQFLSQIASPNPDPAPKKAKSSSTIRSKTVSASSVFSEASAAHKASDFEEHFEHASTIVLSDDGPLESPLPIVENTRKPMVVSDVIPPLPTLATSSELRSACLQEGSTHCVLVLLPKQENDAQLSDDAVEALAGFATVEQKHSKRKANIFPAYAIPSTNEDASILRQELGLKSDTNVDVVVTNIKKGWWKKYAPSSFDGKSIENFMDDIKFGEGVKQNFPVNFISGTNTADVPEPEIGGVPEENVVDSTSDVPTSLSTHDEL